MWAIFYHAFYIILNFRFCINEELTKTIFNGRASIAGQFPFYVYIEDQTRQRNRGCGGSIISKNYILTVAQCAGEGTKRVNIKNDRLMMVFKFILFLDIFWTE